MSVSLNPPVDGNFAEYLTMQFNKPAIAEIDYESVLVSCKKDKEMEKKKEKSAEKCKNQEEMNKEEEELFFKCTKSPEDPKETDQLVYHINATLELKEPATRYYSRG